MMDFIVWHWIMMKRLVVDMVPAVEVVVQVLLLCKLFWRNIIVVFGCFIIVSGCRCYVDGLRYTFIVVAKWVMRVIWGWN